MNRLLKILAAVLGLGAAGAAPAIAADLPVKAPAASMAYPATYSWTGAYIDAFFGGAWNSTHPTVTDGNVIVDIGAAPKGVMGGAELGYDFQLGQRFVGGLFVSAALANINDGGAVTQAQVDMLSAGIATNYLGAAGARLGFLVTPSTLLAAKGGFGFGGAKPNFQVGSLQQAAADTSTGWMVGADLEHRLDANWFVKASYEHYQLGDKSLSFVDSQGNLIATSTTPLHVEVAKVGVGYRF